MQLFLAIYLFLSPVLAQLEVPNGDHPALDRGQGSIWCDSLPQDAGQSVPELISQLNKDQQILPNGRHVGSYPTWTLFCATWQFGGLMYHNMGGRCDRMGPFDTVKFGAPYGDRDIRARLVFVSACWTRCHCYGERDAQGVMRQPDRPVIGADYRQVVGGFGINGGRLGSGGSDQSSSSLYSISPSNWGSEWGSRQCLASKRCTENKDCQSKPGGSCACVARQIQATPALFAGAWCGGLMKASSGILGRRSIMQQPQACACNQSYVSSSCCFAGSAGLVWEASTRRMGSLTLDL